MSSVFPLAKLIVPPMEDQICLGGGEIMGYAGRTSGFTVSTDDVIVFTIFLAVRSPLQQSSSFLNG